MNPKIELFIKDHIWAIDKNLFAALYQLLVEDPEYSGFDIADFTRTLYTAEIDPTDYLETIPPAFLFSDDDITVVAIPDGIKAIGYSAYFDCKNIKKIYFPYSVQKIEDQAFWGCNHIEELTIMNPDMYMEEDSFSNNRLPLIKIIHYNGTKDEYINRKFPFVGEHVYCTDGELEDK